MKKLKPIYFFVLFFIFLFSFFLFKSKSYSKENGDFFSCSLPKYKNSPVCKREHPRLHITKNTLSYYRNKIKNYYLQEYQKFVNFVDSNFEAGKHKYGLLIADYLALIYLLGPIEGINYPRSLSEYKNRAIELLEKVAEGSISSGNNAHQYRYESEIVARAYDWLYNELTENQRKKIANWLAQKGTKALDYARYQLSAPSGLFSSRYFEKPVMPWYIGLAFYGDGYSSSVAQKLLDSFEELMLNGRWLDAQNWVARYKGGVSEIGKYGLWHPAHHIISLDAWRTATNENWFAKGTDISGAYFVRYYPLFNLYRLKPAEPKVLIKWGQIDSGTTLGPAIVTHHLLEEVLKTVDLKMASLNRWLIENRIGELKYPWQYFWDFLFGDRSIKAKSPSELNLPLTQYFEGVGMVVMRQGFEDLNDTAIVFGAPQYVLGGHSWFGIGSIPFGFTIDKYGPLAIKRGSYLRGAQHRQNVMRFSTKENPLDGGFRALGNPPKNITLYNEKSRWYLGGIKRIETYKKTKKYDYIFADYSRLYQPEKITSYTRQFVYLRPEKKDQPDYIIIFDRVVATKPEIIKKWEINMAYNPKINGKERKIKNGVWEYDGANLIEITNDIDPDPYSQKSHPEAHGKLYVKTLLPKKVKMIKIGGPGYEFADELGNNKGKNADYKYLKSAGALFTGTYFVDVLALGKNTKENFLHFLQTADAKKNQKLVRNELIEEEKVVGVHIDSSNGQDEWAVVFSREEKLQERITYNLKAYNSSGLVRHLITDLKTGYSYSLYQNGRKIGEKVSSQAGTIYFVSRGGGEFQITRGKYVGFPRIEIKKTTKFGSRKIGEEIEYTIEIKNIGIGKALNVKVVDQLPSGVKYLKMTEGEKPLVKGNYLEWNIATLLPKERRVLKFIVKVK